MKRVVFVAPFFLPATLRFVNAVAMLQPSIAWAARGRCATPVPLSL